MKENRFLRFVGRFNGLLHMAAGLLAIGVLGFAGYKIYQHTTREGTASDIVIVSEDHRVVERWQLGQLKKIEGSPYLMIPLYSRQKYAQAYHRESFHSTRNILFINALNDERRWLFDTDDYLILRDELLSEMEYYRDTRPIRAILYTVVKKDTDGDKRLTDEDKKVVALSTPSGKGYKELLEEIDAFIDHQMLNRYTLLIIYQKGGVAYSVNVSLKDFTISSQRELPRVKNRP